MNLYERFLKNLSDLHRGDKKNIHLTSFPAPVSEGYPLRSSQENELYRVLCRRNHHILLYGPGGTGKTFLARKLFYRLHQNYERLAWVEYGSDLRTSLAAAFPEFEDIKDTDLRFSKIVRKLAEEPDETILFIDDVKENANNDDILARITGLGITIFMTSRCEKIPPYITYPIDSISTAECVELFYANYTQDHKRKHIKTVWKLAGLLDRNVFAILLLARVIGAERNLEVYVKKLSAELRAATESPKTPAQYIELLLNVSKLNPNEKRILQCFSLMPSGETPLDICKWFNFEKGDLELLVTKGWLEKNTEQNTYILHDLVREYFQSNELPERIVIRFLQYATLDNFFTEAESVEAFQYKLDCIELALAMSSNRIPFYAEASLLLGDIYDNTNEYGKSLAYYTKALESAKLKPTIDSTLLTNIYWNMGIAYDDSSMYAESLECYRHAEKYLSNSSNSNHADIAGLQNNIGIAYHNQANYVNALYYYEKALDIRKQKLDSESSDIANCYNNIGAVYSDIGKYDKALEYHNKALDIHVKTSGAMHPHTAISYNSIGNCYLAIGDSDKALEFHEKALTIQEKILGSVHLDTAASYGNIGNVYYTIGDYENALLYYRKSMIIEEEILGSNHLTTAVSYNNIGNIYCDLGNYAKALSYYQQALDIREQVLGFKHPDTASCYINIGFVYSEIGKNTEALEYHTKALKIAEASLGLEHPSTANCYCSLGTTYHEMGDYIKAIEYYQKALNIQTIVLDHSHPDIANSYNNLGETFCKIEKYTEALEYHQRALQIRASRHTVNLINLSESYDNLCVVHCALNDLEKAKEYGEKALTLRKEKLPQNHPDISKALFHLGNVYAASKDRKAAFQYWVKALSISEKGLGVSHPQTIEINQTLQKSFEHWYPNQNFDTWLQKELHSQENFQ